MRRTAVVAVAIAGGVAGEAAAERDAGDGPVRLSLASESDRAAWERSGFRLALGLAYGKLRGLRSVPDLETRGVEIRPGLRLDAQWSIYASFQYAKLDLPGGWFAATVEPTWHVTSHIAVALGVGYAGFIGLSPPYDDRERMNLGELGQSYTYPDSSVLLGSCEGGGATGHARVELGYVLGPRARTHLALEAMAQWIGCVDSSGIVDDYTGQALVARQWWGHTGARLAWGIEWR